MRKRQTGAGCCHVTVHDLTLTELGQARAAEVEDERQEMFKVIFDRLTAEEKQTLAETLDKLIEEEKSTGAL